MEPINNERPPTIPMEPGNSRGGRKTIYRPVAGKAGEGAGLQVGARIVGVLLSYTRKPDGEIFAVREGRNLVGRDPDQCDIVILGDDTVSGKHCNITFRAKPGGQGGGKFVLLDTESSAGTDLDDEPLLPQQPHELHNRATIRVGATYLTFIAAEAVEP